MKVKLLNDISKSELAEIKKWLVKQYAQIYQHYGCELYNQTLASNGVTRYNLVWKIDM